MIKSNLGWALAIGGMGVVGFYLFEKNKPTIASEQLNAIDSEIGTIKAKAEEKPKTEEEKTLEALDVIQKMTDEEKKKFTASGTSLSSGNFSSITNIFSGGGGGGFGSVFEEKSIAMDRLVEKEFPLPVSTQPVDVYFCIKLDKILRDLIVKIEIETKKVLNKKGDQFYVNSLLKKKSFVELSYNSNSCPFKIEENKLKESGLEVTKGAILTEESSSVKKSNIDQEVFIGVGALIAFTGFYMIFKK